VTDIGTTAIIIITTTNKIVTIERKHELTIYPTSLLLLQILEFIAMVVEEPTNLDVNYHGKQSGTQITKHHTQNLVQAWTPPREDWHWVRRH
jgi:hypothetical protein